MISGHSWPATFTYQNLFSIQQLPLAW